MELQSITPTKLRQNLYQYIKDVNHGESFDITGKDKENAAVLISATQYRHLKQMEITFQTTPQDLIYQKLNLLDEIENNATFYAIGASFIINTFRQNMAPNQDPMWPLTGEFLACLSCYVLRANKQPLTQKNLKELSNKSFDELVKTAKIIAPTNQDEAQGYQKTVDHAITTLESLATSKATRDNMMQLYRLML